MLYSPIAPLLSPSKVQQIVSWRAETERWRSPNDFSNVASTSSSAFHGHPISDCDMNLPGPWEEYHQAMDDEFDMDRWTFVFEGDQRILSLPHPTRNPLLTADLDLLHNEYVSVLLLWNEFEMEKWQAEKMLRSAATPDSVQRVFTADFAIESASTATRYIETHAKQHGLHYNFDGLFFRIYQAPGFALSAQDEGPNDSPFVVQPRHVAQQPLGISFPACTPGFSPLAMPSRMIQV